MSRSDEIQAEVERIANVITNTVNDRLDNESPPSNWNLKGLPHDRIYLKVWSHHRSSYSKRTEQPKALIPELAHLSEHQLKDRVERAAEQGLVVKIKGSQQVTFTSHRAKATIDRLAAEKEFEKEALLERVERLIEKTGLDIEFPKSTWDRSKIISTTIQLDLDEFEEFVSKVMR